AVDAFLLQVLQQFPHVPSGAPVILVTGLHATEIRIEGGNFNKPQLVGLAVAFDFNHLALGGLFFQLDLVADNADDAGFRLVGSASPNNPEANYVMFVVADQVPNVFQAPADHFNDLACGALATTHDPVGRVQFAAF